MRSSEEDIVLLENYLKGNLSEKEMVEVASRIEQEKDLGLDLQDLKTLFAGMRLSALKGKMDLLKGLEDQISSSKKQPPKNFKWIWVIVGALVLGIAVFWALKKSDDKAKVEYVMGDEEFYQYILHNNERSLAVDTIPEVSNAYNLFTAKEFKLAEPLLVDLWESKKDTLAYYYLAITYIQLNNCKKALTILSSSELQKFSSVDLIKKCEIAQK